MRRRAVITDAIRSAVIGQYTTRQPDGTWRGSKLIAADVGVSDATVRNILRAAGVQIRDGREAHAHGKRCGPIKHTAQLGDAPLCACGCGQRTRWVRSKYQWAKYADESHWHKPAPFKSRDWLLEHYVSRHRPILEIAREFGVDQTSVYRALERNGIPRRDAQAAHKGTQTGERNPAWKGGVTPERQRLYKTSEWKDFVKQVFDRDNYTCQRCGKAIAGARGNRHIAAHHIKTWADYPELRMEMTNVVTLCRPCHLWVHSKANTAQEFLK